MNNEYIERLVAVEQRSKSNTKRLDEHLITLTDHDRRMDKLWGYFFSGVIGCVVSTLIAIMFANLMK